MSELHDPDLPLSTKIKSSAQVMICIGCCCGRPDRGKPEVPVERLKATWKSEKLNRVVQLTISGCLGPCDVPNVAAFLTAGGIEWYGLLDGDAHYDAIIAWARECASIGQPVPLPSSLETHRLRRFAPPFSIGPNGTPDSSR